MEDQQRLEKVPGPLQSPPIFFLKTTTTTNTSDLMTQKFWLMSDEFELAVQTVLITTS